MAPFIMKSCIIFLGLSLLVSAGCAKLAHMDQLLTIKAYSDNTGEQARYVDDADKRFEMLLEAVRSNALEKDMSAEQIKEIYGVPLYVSEVKDGRPVKLIWMYRYQMIFKGSEKVYLYFDHQGNLVKWDYKEPDRS